MKILLGVVAGVVIAGSLTADYLWRRWMRARKREREKTNGGQPPGGR